MPFFAIKFFLTPLSAPFDGHRRCCDPAYGGPASRANNTGCLYLMYRMMCNMCARPPRSAPLSCCPAAGRRRGAGCGGVGPIVGRGPVAGRRTSLLRDDFVQRPARHSSGSGCLAMRWLCNVCIISVFALLCPARRRPCRMGRRSCAMKKLRKKCRFSLSFANFTSKP